jgi:hypothetical protein
MQRQPRIVEPLGQRHGGAAIAVIEMALDREHFDRVETMRGNLHEMIAVESIGDVQMR